MSNPLSGTHKIYRQPELYYRWGIKERDVALEGLEGTYTCIELFVLSNQGFNEMHRWLGAQDPVLVKPLGSRWMIESRILTMFTLKFGPGLGDV